MVSNKLLSYDCSPVTKVKAAWEGELNILAFTYLLARCCLLLHWKSTKAPSNTKWLSDTMSFLKLEKMKFSLRGDSDKLFTKWQLFLTFLNSLQCCKQQT